MLVDLGDWQNPVLTSGEDYFAQHLARVPAFRALIRGLENQLFSQEALQAPVLDVGCGDGHFAAVAFPGGIDVGIDLTWEIVAEGRAHGRYGHVEVADGTRLPYPSAAFRTVVSNCVIEHIPDIEGLIGEVARVLVPGGRFLFSVPNDSFTGALFTASNLERLGLHRQAESFGRWWNRRAAHYHLEPTVVWQARLARHGLLVDRHVSYMSQEATRAFELAHYYSVPSLAWHRVTGQWSLRPQDVKHSLAFRWLRRYAAEPEPVWGTNTFFVSHKAS